MLIHCPAGLAVLAKNGAANWAFETVPQPGLNGRRGYQPRGKVLGGSSSVNAMIYLRGQPRDYDDWAAEGNPGWSWAEVLPYFKRAEHNERGADAWHGTRRAAQRQGPATPHRFGGVFVEAGAAGRLPAQPRLQRRRRQEGVGLYQVTHKNGERFSVAKGYLTPNLGRPNLTVVTSAHTTPDPCSTAGARAASRCASAARRRRYAARREVLLSAGALQSPQLLMLSGIGPAEHLRAIGIEVRHDLPGVGANLHDHVDVVQVLDAPQLKDLFGLSLAGAVNAIKGIFEWRRHRRGMLTTNFAEAGGFIRSRPEEERPDLQLHFVIGKLVDHGRKTVFGHGYSCHVCLLRPKSRGSVRLASADPMAAPLIDPNFLAEPDDLRAAGARLQGDAPHPRAAGARRRTARASWRPRPAHAATPRSRPSSAAMPTPSTTRSAPAAWAPGRWTWSTPSCACAACRACASSTPRSCRRSSAATPTRRRS